MPPTFYAPRAEGSGPGGRVALEEEEERHARALRVREGDTVHLTDGRGGRWRAVYRSTGGGAACEIVEAAPAPPPLPVELAFGVANKSRTLWLVEKAVELGALSLRPVSFRRSRSVADAARGSAFWRKASRRAVAALKQCGGARLPEVGPVCELHELLEERARPDLDGGLAPDGPEVLLSRTADRTLGEALESWDGSPPARLLVGPEGGLEEEERAACRAAGFVLAGLGPRTLRFETAGIVALAVAGQRVEEARSTAGVSAEKGGGRGSEATSS